MKNLMIGTLIVILGIGTALADRGDQLRTAINLQQQSASLAQRAQAEQMRNTSVPYGYYGYSAPYTGYYAPAAAPAPYYPYPTDHAVVIPVPSANEISNPNDISYSTYTEKRR